MAQVQHKYDAQEDAAFERSVARAREAGAYAYTQHHRVITNPHMPGSARWSAWEDGWENARKGDIFVY